jgi:protein arginine N-methyltransferase 1
VIRPGETTVADIGAGTGILGFLARELGAREVHLIEHGEVLRLAEQLAADNGLDGLQFWPMPSTEMLDPPRVDVVVAEVLGNLALEENALETLADARRFLKPRGILIPQRIEQFAAPVTANRFRHELETWDRVGHGLDFSAAKRVSFNNVYVHRMSATDLLAQDDAGQRWDTISFDDEVNGYRRGTVRWVLTHPVTLHGFALWWRCTLVPGVALSTAPDAPPTHWDQVYAPILNPIECAAGDVAELALESETGGEAGIGMRWTVVHRRGAAEVSRQAYDLGQGMLAVPPPA